MARYLRSRWDFFVSLPFVRLTPRVIQRHVTLYDTKWYMVQYSTGGPGQVSFDFSGIGSGFFSRTMYAKMKGGTKGLTTSVTGRSFEMFSSTSGSYLSRRACMAPGGLPFPVRMRQPDPEVEVEDIGVEGGDVGGTGVHGGRGEREEGMEVLDPMIDDGQVRGCFDFYFWCGTRQIGYMCSLAVWFAGKGNKWNI